MSEEEIKTFDTQGWKELMIQQRKKRVVEDGKRYFNETWEDVTPEFKELAEKCLINCNVDNRFSLAYVARPYVKLTGYYVICLHGGQNGNGSWLSYSNDFANIMNNLLSSEKCNFKKVWLIDWKNDCSDDVFDLWIGVRK